MTPARRRQNPSPELSPSARRALARAEGFARRHGELERFPGIPQALAYLTADHILLGVAHPDGAAEVWAALGINPAELHEALARSLAVGEWPPPPTDTPPDKRPQPVAVEPDSSALRALEYAGGEARRLRSPEVGPEHLLLGALRAGESKRRAPESLGHLLLESRGITLAGVFEILLAQNHQQP